MLPKNYDWEFAIPGDPLPSLVTQPAPENCAIALYSNGVSNIVLDGHGAFRFQASGLMIRRAQQYLISLFGVLDPRVHGIICDLEERPNMLLVVEVSTGRATVMPSAIALDFLRSVNVQSVLARPASASS